MFEEKESFWKKRGFYLSACVLLIGVMAVGALFYRQTNLADNESNMMAGIATEVPDTTADNTGNSAISSEKDITKEEVQKANTDLVKSITSQKKDTTSTAEKTKESTKKSKTKTSKKETTKKAVSTSANNTIKYSFNEEKGLLWPVKGDVILKYSMNNAIYFKTLAQYKCNPAISIASKVGTKVKAAADCRVTKIEKSDELGTIVTTDIGDSYKVSYGQIDNISVNKGDNLKEGDIIGTIAEPTKYYTEEGSHLYLQVKEGKETVDPMLLLR